MPPDGAAHNGRRGLLRRTCSRDAPGNCDEYAPSRSVPGADVRAVASFVCARAHRASALSGRPADPGPSCVPRSRQGWYTRWPTDRRGIGARGSAFPPLRQSLPSSNAALRSSSVRKVGPTHTQNGPPSVASRKYEPPVRCPARAPLGSPPPGHHPYLVQRDAMPKVGEAPCRGALPLASSRRGGPSHLRVVRVQRRRVPSRLPADPANASAPAAAAHGLAVATMPRAVVAVPLRPLLPNPDRCGGVVEPSRPGESHTPPSGPR
jgi:hypothetical protein